MNDDDTQTAAAPKTRKPKTEMTAPYICIPDMCRAFARAYEAYEADKKVPCPKPGFDGWGEVNEWMGQLAKLLSKTAGVEVVWDAKPNMEDNPLGELGRFEKKEPK